MKECELQGLDPGTKVCNLINGIKCDKISIAIFAVKAYPDKYEKNFDAVVAYLSQYVEKGGLTMSVIVVSITQSSSNMIKG